MQEKNKSQFYAEYALCTRLTVLQFSTYLCVLCSVTTHVTQEPKWRTKNAVCLCSQPDEPNPHTHTTAPFNIHYNMITSPMCFVLISSRIHFHLSNAFY